jgi:molybdopterin/thiamine biosynthesis adenylyltransferase
MSFTRARVLVVGVGGLGCPAAMALARAGVGTLGLVDDDAVDRTNLHRQILFSDADVGAPKVEAARRALTRLAPQIRIETHATRLLPGNAVELAGRYDLVLEGSDNFPTKFLVSDACRLAARPVVHGAAVRWHGTALAVEPAGRPCYRCLFEDIPREDAPSCAEAGVVGPVVGVVGAAQADLALSLLQGEPVGGELFTFDGRALLARRRRISARPGCMLCGDARAITGIEVARYAPETCDL